LADLQASRDSALDASRSAQERLNQLPDDADPRLRDRLSAEQSKHALRYNQLHRLVSSVNEYVVRLRLAPGTALAPAPPLDIQSRSAPAAEVASTREQIQEVLREIAAVRRAPLKHGSRQAAVVMHLANLARRVRPRISFDAKGVARIGWLEDMVVDKSEVLGMICWALGPLGPQELASAFELEQEGEPEGAVSPEEREERLGKLSDDLLALERREEALIERAAADGTEVLRRPEASPMAVLGIQIVEVRCEAAAEAEAAVA
jgi:hypothetical protein